MAPPAKRRRRNPLADSDDEDERPRANTLSNFLISSPTSPSKARTSLEPPSPLKASRAGVNLALPSANASPTKTRRGRSQKNGGASPIAKKPKDAGRGQEKGRTADLKTLFSKQTQRAPVAGSSSSEKRPAPTDDPISDPISEDDEISDLKATSSSLVSHHVRKRLKSSGGPVTGASSSTSLRFLKPPKPTHPRGLDDESRPWSERFGPRNLDELAVHKRKITDVRRWLDHVMTGRLRQRVLVLKGAAGCGKTTTMRLLANDMGFELLEWKNPTSTTRATSTGTGFISWSAQFDEFLGRGGKFGTLDIDGGSPDSSTPASSLDTATGGNTKRVMLMEEFPTTFSRSNSVLSSFRSAILEYIAAHTPSSLARFGNSMSPQSDPIRPLVLVITETLLTTASASADSLTAHRLLGPEILRHPGVGVIEFNAIAPTFLAKALDLVVLKEARQSGRRRTPGPQVLKRLGEIGDIRSAISSLEFLCLKGDGDSDWGAQVVFSKKLSKSAKEAISLTEGESESLELISQREASLGIFHAVGKVVHNKRDDETSADDAVESRLPPYLSQHARPKRSQVFPDTLIDETGTDTQTFISALHENYLLSCESTGPMDLSTPIDYVNDCIEYLSESDLLCPSRDTFFGAARGGFGAQNASSSHAMRQDEMAFHVAVRGLLFSLPNPVKRRTTTAARGVAKGGDAFKMFYPTSLKLWRAKEEIQGMVDLWSTKLLKGEAPFASSGTKNMTDGATAFLTKTQRSSTGDATTSWMERQQQARAAGALKNTALQSTLSNTTLPTRPRSTTTKTPSADPPPPLLSLGSAAQRELLLDRLPYMAHMARSRKTTSLRVGDLEKVVSFTGLSAPEDDHSDSPDEDVVPAVEAWATDRPFEEGGSPRCGREGIKAGGAMGALLAQKLVLSDDDIEDD
ncbi:related to cell cycle checkpoint protein RAD17 [Claviceps purpurea 20.1]|uniref:Related to cell cycle checkpoint protein RAD17 n=1 Tax=Claviceps purpurea (strain 20.1) TaxID=1111077 RepID=M1VXR5_CLAP2|nr:hypothetical protein E4U23_006441 [Claviceps purpurea]CCE33392.1 related to cell cycle checkpoint protein RAD17 [Claviceps purpurea 20.1]